MSTIPSLALIPSGVKASKVYSVLPTDGTGDFTFSRAGALPSYNATRVNSEGLIEEVLSNVPRLNYPLIDGVVSGCPSLLLEPQRTNLITYSEDFTDASWAKIASVNPNNSISPDGTQNADTFTDLSTQYQDVRSTPIIISANSTYTSSCFIKKTKGSLTNYAGFGVFLTGILSRVDYYIINTTTGVINIDASSNINFSSYYIEDYGNYWRVVCTFKDNQSNTNCTLLLYPAISTNGTSINQNAQGSNVFWGAQLELGSYPTSYIPTNGSQVTRVAETANGAGDASTFNDSEGVLFAEIKGFEEIPSDSGYITISSPSVSFDNALLMQFRSNGDLRIYFGGSASSNIQFIAADINFTDNNKIAVQYDSIGSNYKLFVNGVAIARYGLATNQSVVGLSELNLNYSNLVALGNTKQIQYFDSALNDSDLETLTSWTSFSEMATSQLYTIE